MRKIAHISDLHFGAESEDVPEQLIADLSLEQPDLVVVSGDLTQYGRSVEFKAARDFLTHIPFPQLVVPGNHDIPWVHLFKRAITPMSRFRKYITPDLFPVFEDDAVIVLGISTPRKFRPTLGEISRSQREYLRDRLCTVDRKFKIVVTHHPFIPPPFGFRWHLVKRGLLTLEEMRGCEADLILAGHLHRGYARDVKTHYPAMERSIIIAQAGTATSHRVRGEDNSFNIITVRDERSFTITAKVLKDGVFADFRSTNYRKTSADWEEEDVVNHFSGTP